MDPDLNALNDTLDLMMALDPVLSAVVSYRDRLLEEGFSTVVAERMTEEFHRVMLSKATGA